MEYLENRLNGNNLFYWREFPEWLMSHPERDSDPETWAGWTTRSPYSLWGFRITLAAFVLALVTASFVHQEAAVNLTNEGGAMIRNGNHKRKTAERLAAH